MPKNVNRYQMKVVAIGESRNTEIYLLDKEKGTIWMTKEICTPTWGRINYDYAPWVQLPPLPIQK
jgi:hypothetical protein